MSNLKLKKGLSLILAIIMLFSVVPTAVFAVEEGLPVMKAYSYISASALPEYHQYRATIVTATFLDKIDTTGAVASWDISASAATGEVKAWVKLNEEETLLAGEDRHDLYIGGNGGVAANENSTQVFSLFPKLKKVIGLENYHTDNVKNLSWFFEGCSSLESVDISSFNTSNVTNLSYFMIDCKSLKSVDFSNWDTSKVTTMQSMFKNCKEITEIDISSFDTSKVTNMNSMFYNCEALSNLYVGKGWNVENVTHGKTAFSCCKSLPNFDENNSGVDISFANQYVKDESEKPKTEQYKVTYSFTGDIIPEGVEAPVEATYDAGKTVTVAENPSADKYIFSGWTTEDATVENGEFVINNDVNFVGSWTKLYKVEYKYEEDRMSVGYIFKNMVTIGLVVAVMFHFIIQ